MYSSKIVVETYINPELFTINNFTSRVIKYLRLEPRKEERNFKPPWLEL